jgi:hypothetical protein
MGTRGPNRRLDLEGEYWRLLSAGMGTVEACREIGVGRKTVNTAVRGQLASAPTSCRCWA